MMPVSNINDDFLPPPSGPPRLLTDDQIMKLSRQGHLPLPLPRHLLSLYAQLDAASTEFFSLPLPNKTALYSPSNGTELGFVCIPSEKDYVTFRAQTAHANTQLEQLVAAVWQETYTLLYRILGDLSYAMNLNHDVWDKVIDGTSPMPPKLEEATPTLLRIFRYEANEGIAERHTDMGLLTLCVCQGEGLQVLVRGEDGADQWIEYSEPTLLVGQTLKILSGNLVKPGVHRVVGNPTGRGSVVFALRPNTRNEVDLRMFPGKKNQDQGVMHMGELWKSIWLQAYNVNAPKEVREKQKQQKRLNMGKNVDYQTDNKYDISNTRAAFA